MIQLEITHKSGCLICAGELIYYDEDKKFQCSICNAEFISNAECINGHFVCDECHSSDAVSHIEKHCLRSGSVNPIELTVELMHNPKVKMHGPEHHFLVPAVLLTAFCNKTDETKTLSEKLQKAKKRSSKVIGGFCGTHGTCGAAMGTGIFMSIITNSTPLAEKEWQLSNMMTARALTKIAESGGPRCCKRDTFTAVIEAVKFVEAEFNVKLDVPEKINCDFSSLNNECLKDNCTFYINENI